MRVGFVEAGPGQADLKVGLYTAGIRNQGPTADYRGATVTVNPC
jgi:hypothetical protein